MSIYSIQTKGQLGTYALLKFDFKEEELTNWNYERKAANPWIDKIKDNAIWKITYLYDASGVTAMCNFQKGQHNTLTVDINVI